MSVNPIEKPQRQLSGMAIDPAGLRQSMQIEDKQARAEAVASQLEGVFMDMMVKAMRATVPEDGISGKGLGGKNYIEMLDQQYAQMQGFPRDPRFHDALVRQIMQTPEQANQAMERMRQSDSRVQAAAEGEMAGDLIP